MKRTALCERVKSFLDLLFRKCLQRDRLERCLSYFLATEYGTWEVDTIAGVAAFNRLWEKVLDAMPSH